MRSTVVLLFDERLSINNYFDLLGSKDLWWRCLADPRIVKEARRDGKEFIRNDLRVYFRSLIRVRVEASRPRREGANRTKYRGASVVSVRVGAA